MFALVCAFLLLAGCRQKEANTATIEFTRIPQADEGRDKNDIIEGRVTGAGPAQQIVLYSRSGSSWWVQPLEGHAFTKIQKSKRWWSPIHLGTEYAALLVDPQYVPPATLAALPEPGAGVAAVASIKGGKSPPSPSIRFSGYEWRVRDAPSNRGGTNTPYSPANVWTDAQGALHLRIAKISDQWTCSEVSLTRSLGYGTYSFVVQDTSRLEPAAVLSFFTWDYVTPDPGHGEADIEISHWGDPSSKNAQYVVQPYFVPLNVTRFTAPSGTLTHSFHWEAGRMTFRTVRGSQIGAEGNVVAGHAFTSGVSAPGMESVRMNLYVFSKAKSPLQHGAEVVIEKFEYLP